MGKTPKKAAPGGDERNLYVRRLKATTAPSKASESSLHERQRESESSKRPQLAGIQKRIPTAQGKNFKSKLRLPRKHGSNLQGKKLSKSSVTSKNKKASASSAETVEPEATDMQPESEESEVILNVSAQKENVEVSASDKDEDTVDLVPEKDSNPEDQVVSQTVENEEPALEEQIEVQEDETPQENASTQNKETEEQDDSDLKLSYEMEEIPVKVQEDQSKEKEPLEEKLQESTQPETHNGTTETENVQSEPQTDTETCSTDIVEATTAELSKTTENVSPNSSPQLKEKSHETATNDASFVSYDPSIMLKDVQIKLNDCLKENSKFFDVSNGDHDSTCERMRDMSFGQTLRSISGRHSISRMRHVTLREQRYSPNSSLFVNTSTASLPQDELGDFKILRYSSSLSDAHPVNNDTPTERKRKLEAESWNSAKKQKTESQNSLLNTSIGLLKGFRRPVQVSTPVTEYEFSSNKLNISGINKDESKMLNEPIEGTKKWCVIM